MVAFAQSLARGKKVTLPKSYERDLRRVAGFLTSTRGRTTVFGLPAETECQHLFV